MLDNINKDEIATLAGGCFWCLEPFFKELKGVNSVLPGYTGGKVKNPSYEQVASGNTGHAEAIQIKFDAKIISYRELLEVFFTMHDPTTLNRQGADIGTQYRSVIFYHNQKQKEIAGLVINDFEKKSVWDDPIVTELVELEKFYPAAAYHKDYYNKHRSQPYCQVVIAPKLAKFRKKFNKKLI